MKPWHQFQIDHPNRFFEDMYRDYRYAVYQNDYGHLNGYVLLKEDDDREKASDLECHGGISFEDDLSQIIPVESGHWVGFDCNHYRDLAPFMNDRMRAAGIEPSSIDDGIWRTEDYVVNNCKSMIDQLIEMKKGE